MNNGEPRMLTQEEIAKNQKERILSDAELVNNGAEVTAEGKIFPTEDEQKINKFNEEAKLAEQNANEFVKDYRTEEKIKEIEKLYGHPLKINIRTLEDSPETEPDMYTLGANVSRFIDIHDEKLFNNGISDKQLLIIKIGAKKADIQEAEKELNVFCHTLNCLDEAKEERGKIEDNE